MEERERVGHGKIASITCSFFLLLALAMAVASLLQKFSDSPFGFRQRG
jgi:hypothetical protein